MSISDIKQILTVTFVLDEQTGHFFKIMCILRMLWVLKLKCTKCLVGSYLPFLTVRSRLRGLDQN